MWALIDRGKTIMHCGNTTFIYYNDLSKYMTVEGATSEDALNQFFDVGVGKFLS